MYQYRVLPCPNFAKEDILIIQKYGFLTYPFFIDNGFKTKGGLRWKKAVKNAEHYRPLFFIVNDEDWKKDIELIAKYSRFLIFPIHELSEIGAMSSKFNHKYTVGHFLGYPNNRKLRDYNIYEFLEAVKYHKKWWLGLHDYPVNDPRLIKEFQGFDSTLPELYAGKYGKIWKNWRDYYKPGNSLHWRVIFEQNVQNFRLFLDNLKSNGKPLEEYLAGTMLR